jgi:hypothetical protein
MTFWDGTRWLPEPSAAEPSPPSKIHRLLGAGVEASLITILVFGLIATTVFAGQGGKQTYGLNHDGFEVWGEPYAFADFTVTRSKVDGTDVWVKADCVDSSGAQAIPGADPLRLVAWDTANPLVGHAALDSVMDGTTCEAWLTKSPRQSTGPAPGWPGTWFEVAW